MNASRELPATRRKRTGVLLLAWAAVAFAVTIQALSPAVPNNLLAVEALVILVLAVISISAALPSRFWAPAPVFLLVVGVFHLGLTPFWILNMTPDFPRSSDYVWFFGPDGGLALLLALAGIVVYTLAVLVLSFFSKPVILETLIESKGVSARSYASWGAVILIGSLLGWFITAVLRGGAGIFFGSYTSFLEATSGSNLDDLYYAIGVGLGLTLLSKVDTSLLRVAVIFFVVFALIAFFIGLRGEVLFPIAVGVTVLGFRRRMPNSGLILIGMLVVLAAVNAAKQIRQLGAAGTQFDWSEASPLAALAELGSSIRVVATVVSWKGRGEGLSGGETYVVAIVRAWESVMDPANRPPAASDFRLFNSEIAYRAGSIGGSVIGEAYHNFAFFGVVGIMLLLGLFFGYMSVSKPNATQIAIYVCIAVPLFNHVRNSFVPVIPAIIAGLVFLLCIKIFSGRKIII